MKNLLLISPIILTLTSNVFAANVIHTDIHVKNFTKSDTIYATVKKVEKRYIIESGKEQPIRLETMTSQIPIALSAAVFIKKPQNFFKGIVCSNATLTVTKSAVGDYVVSIDESRC